MIYSGIVGPDSPAPESARLSTALTVIGVGIIAVCAFVIWLYVSTSYEITVDELIVRFGPFRRRFQLASITEAIPRNAPLGPALSLATSWDMVYIKFRKSAWPLAVSPANKTEFLRDLAERVPGLARRGDGAQKDGGEGICHNG